jgi:membrane fusion protein (multidrug efflux system)
MSSPPDDEKTRTTPEAFGRPTARRRRPPRDPKHRDRDSENGKDEDTDQEESDPRKNGKNEDEGKSKGEGKNEDEGEGEGENEKENKKPKGPPFYKRPIPMLILGICVVVCIIVGLIWWLYARQWESTDDAFIDGHVIQMAPKVAAIVSAVHFDDNWRVRKNALLIELDPRDFQVVVDQRKADLAVAEDKLLQAQAQLKSAQLNIEQMAAELAIAQVNANNATTDYKRYASLKVEARSQEQMDNVATTKKSSDAQVTEAKAKLASSYADEAQAESSVKVAEANVSGAQADLHQAQINLGYCKIYAPDDGLITQKNVEPGDYIQVGQPLFAIVPTNVWVIANYKETQLDLIRPGQPVDIEVDAYSHKKFHGKVDSIQNGTGSKFTLLPPENATGNYVKIVQRVPVKIFIDPRELQQSDVLLAPGMSVVPDIKVR